MHPKLPEMATSEELKGLAQKDIPGLQARYGKNIFQYERSYRFLHIIWDIVREPMFILLAIACLLYFFLGEPGEGFLMLAAMGFVSAISIYQEARTGNALKALNQFTEPKVIVIRDGEEMMIERSELVVDDIVILEEGNKIPADAIILQANDLTINESIITGESLPVDKSAQEGSNLLYQGTTINSGKCMVKITATGNRTVLGKLGKSVQTYASTKTLLQQQTATSIRRLVFFGLTAFVLIFLVNYLDSGSWAQSLLLGLTLAMAAIPEEIPVAFSSFMALGAYHMSKLGIISRQPQTIENLGAVSVLCLDKTGTITENRMELKMIYDYNTDRLYNLKDTEPAKENRVLYYAMLASEARPFDPMEKAVLEAFSNFVSDKASDVKRMVHEYPLEGRPPMMTHVYNWDGTQIVAAKGAAERLLKLAAPGADNMEKINKHIHELAGKGFRVLGIASAEFPGSTLPASQDEFNWKFEGLVSFYDPPRKNISEVLRKINKAGIKIKLLTGDYPETAIQIAKEVGLRSDFRYVTGEQVMEMAGKEFNTTLEEVNLYARMFPEAKLKVIDGYKKQGEIVAMTGDGVNDGPALKSANIGIAMGKKGTEIARLAADLVLTDDNLKKVSDAILQGRKIYNNLKKAIRYIISIHIPIILTASLPVIFSWTYPNIFTPIHVIFLELIMGPTCSIFFEREPAEKNIMEAEPRSRSASLFSRPEIIISILQGLLITAGVLGLYYYYMTRGYSIEETRMVVFTTLVWSNIFLTFANRSFTENITTTIFYKNNLAPWVIGISLCFLATFHLLPFVRNLFQLAPIRFPDFILCTGVAFVSVIWYEIYKTFTQK